MNENMSMHFKMYTDGSYTKKRPSICGYSAFIISEENKGTLIYGGTRDFNYVDLWNIGGEIVAVLAGIEYIRSIITEDLNLKIDIYHDYLGLSTWANGKWKRNKKPTKMYAEKIKEYRNSGIEITFYHVKAHSGHKYNELVDRYAKLGIRKSAESRQDETFVLKDFEII